MYVCVCMLCTSIRIIIWTSIWAYVKCSYVIDIRIYAWRMRIYCTYHAQGLHWGWGWGYRLCKSPPYSRANFDLFLEL